VEHLRYIQSTYTYTSTTTIDASHSVWAGEDVYQVFGDDTVLATTADDSVHINGSFNPEHSVDVGHSFNAVDAFNTEVDLEDSGNTVTGDGNAVGEDAAVGTTDDSYVDASDHAVAVEDSYIDASDHAVAVDDSYVDASHVTDSPVPDATVHDAYDDGSLHVQPDAPVDVAVDDAHAAGEPGL
jgi:hypothetical protein